MAPSIRSKALFGAWNGTGMSIFWRSMSGQGTSLGVTFLNSPVNLQSGTGARSAYCLVSSSMETPNPVAQASDSVSLTSQGQPACFVISPHPGDEASLLSAAAHYTAEQLAAACGSPSSPADILKRSMVAEARCVDLASVLRPAGRIEVVATGRSNGRNLSCSIRPVFAEVDGVPKIGFTAFARAWADEPWKRFGGWVAPTYTLGARELGRYLYSRSKIELLHGHFDGSRIDPDSQAGFNEDALPDSEVSATTERFQAAARIERERYYDSLALLGGAMTQPGVGGGVRVCGCLSLTDTRDGKIQLSLCNGKTVTYITRILSTRDANVIAAAIGVRVKQDCVGESDFMAFAEQIDKLVRQIRERAFPLLDDRRAPIAPEGA